MRKGDGGAERQERGHRSLRLLYVINGLGMGGAERSLLELLPFYLADGIHPIIACFNRKPTGVEPQIRELGCEIRLIESKRVGGRVRRLRQIIRSERIDLIHTTLFDANLAGRLAAVGSGVPLLTSLVNTSYDPIRMQDPNINRLSMWAVRTIDGWTGRHLSTHFQALTEAVKDSAVRTLDLPPERITVIGRGRAPERLGIPSPERRAASRQRLGLGNEDEVIVTAGRQEFQKGQRYLLEAMETLARTRPRLRLLIAGRPGHASDELRRLHDASGLGERILFLGHREDVPEILAAADLFAFPSLFEGFGGAIIEAMALGLPVVASDLPTLREVVDEGRNALLVEPAAAAPLAAAITHLLDNPEKAREFGRWSRAAFEERFTLDQVAQRMLALYRELTGAPTPRMPAYV